MTILQWLCDGIGGIMVNMLTLNGKSWVQAPIESNQRLLNWYLMVIASPLSMQYSGERTKIGWLG